METRISPALNSQGKLLDESIAEAVKCLRAGELVAFPTETVYGLGANALSAEAVARIFEAKGRPSNNPLIVHVANIEQARSLVREWPAEAQQLAEAFWPGPLTFVLKKQNVVPETVTAGGDTVAIRVPAHPVALALIEACGFPLAAPSANRSNQLSPTTAEHVKRGMGGLVALILEGGPCESGIESTVLNLSSAGPEVLRPGVLTANFLSEVLGKPVIQAVGAGVAGSEVNLSPGQLLTHYAPRTPLVLAASADVRPALERMTAEQKKVGLLTFGKTAPDNLGNVLAAQEIMPDSPEAFARRLYAALHNMDECELDVMLCEMPPDHPAWEGVRDRLQRAGKSYSQTKL